MSRSSYTKEQLKKEFRKNLMQRIGETLEKYRNIFIEDKTGLAGIVMLVIIFIMSLTGIVLYKSQSLYQGSNPRFAAPSWLAPFDNHEFKYSEPLIQTQFNEEQDIQRTFENIKTRTSYDGKYIKASTSYNKQSTAFMLNFQETDPSQAITEEDLPSGNIIFTKTINWREKRSPNGLNFELDIQFFSNFEGKSPIYGEGAPYNISIATYVQGESFNTVNGMVEYLNEKTGIEYRYNPTYGIILSDPDYPIGVFDWREITLDIQQRKVIALFKTLKNLEFKFVAKFNIQNKDKALRKAGIASIGFDKMDIVGEGYYSGLMGTTGVGADLYALIAQGLKNSLMLGLSATFVTLFLGVTLGLVAGWYGGKIDETIMRVVDFLMVLPTLPLMLVLATIFRQMESISRVWGVIMALSLISWSYITRIIRSQVLSVRERPYIEAAQASGSTNVSIMFKHILPNVIGLIIYQVVIRIQGAILAATTLSFLGMGPDWVSFGNIMQRVSGVLLGIGRQGGTHGPTGSAGQVQHGAEAVFAAWWFLFFPGLILFLFGTSLIFIGMTIQKAIGGESTRM